MPHGSQDKRELIHLSGCSFGLLWLKKIGRGYEKGFEKEKRNYFAFYL